MLTAKEAPRQVVREEKKRLCLLCREPRRESARERGDNPRPRRPRQPSDAGALLPHPEGIQEEGGRGLSLAKPIHVTPESGTGKNGVPKVKAFRSKRAS